MKNILKRSIAFLAVGIIAFVLVGNNTTYASDVKVADDDVISFDSSGNCFGAGELIDVSSISGGVVENEVFAAGMDVLADNVKVDGSVFMAGNRISIVKSEIGGSVFVAGQSIVIDSPINNNIWAAGNGITLGENTSVKGLHVAGATVTVSGEYVGADISGETVIFNGKASGDVHIEAENVTIGKDAVIDGALTVESANEAKILDGAKAPNYTFIEVKDEEESEEEGNGVIKAAGKAAVGITILHKVKKIVLNLFKYALLAVVFTFLFRKRLEEAYVCSTKRAGAFWGFGALTLFLFPIVAIILCITVIGLPVAGLLAVIYVLAICFARVFAFGSLVRELIFSHTSKRLHPVAEIVLAVLPAAVIKEIPFVGGITGIACAIYTIGYILLAIVDTIKGNRVKKNIENLETT